MPSDGHLHAGWPADLLRPARAFGRAALERCGWPAVDAALDYAAPTLGGLAVWLYAFTPGAQRLLAWRYPTDAEPTG